MSQGFQLGLNDGGAELQNGTATTGNVTIAVQTTQVALATRLTSGVNRCIPITGSTAVLLPKNQPIGSPIMVFNLAASAVPLLVYPAWDDVLGAASGGQIGAGAANAAFSVAQSKGAIFWSLPSSAGVATANGAIGTDWAVILSA